MDEAAARAAISTCVKLMKIPMFGDFTTNCHINRANEVYKLTLTQLKDCSEYLTAEDRDRLTAEARRIMGERQKAGVPGVGEDPYAKNVKTRRNWANRHLNVKQNWKARQYEKGVLAFYNDVIRTSEAHRMDELNPEPDEEVVLDTLVSAKDDPEFHSAAKEAGVRPEDVEQFVSIRGDEVYYRGGSSGPSVNRPTVILQNNTYHVYADPGRNLRRIVSTLDVPNDISPIRPPDGKGSKQSSREEETAKAAVGVAGEGA